MPWPRHVFTASSAMLRSVTNAVFQVHVSIFAWDSGTIHLISYCWNTEIRAWLWLIAIVTTQCPVAFWRQ